MAVAGLHNVSVFDSSYLRESPSPVSRRWGGQDRPSTRGSSLLQMWREIEGEHVVNNPNGRLGERTRRVDSESSDSDHLSTQGSLNGDGSVENETPSCCNSLIESDNEQEDSNSFCSEQSTDLGEDERERVRRIFREWMNIGVKSHSPSALHRNNRSRAPWLGENECERVRITREWMQMNSQQTGTCVSPRVERVSEIGSQIEQVRDGQLVNHCEVVERRPLRKLCGRQALLDLLKKAQMERKKELQHLLECRQVSSFPHRNRIQSLLRGRFLLNRRVTQDEKTCSTAASELGLLRQRHTVSDLREEFLSRLDGGAVPGVQSDASSIDKPENGRNEQSQPGPEQEVEEISQPGTEAEVEQICDQSPGNERAEINETSSVEDMQSSTVEDLNQQEYNASAAGTQEQALGNEELIQELCSGELITSRHIRDGYVTQSQGDQRLQENPNTDSPLHALLPEASDIHSQNDAQTIEANLATEELIWQRMSVQEDQWQVSATENDEGTSRQLANEEIEWREVSDEGISGTWPEGRAHHWYQETSGNETGEHNQMQESDEDWHGDVLQEAIDSWLDVPSREGVGGSFERVGSFYSSDEDNIHNMELRELVSRRRVSTLLQSGFRESLDRLVQSYVERQNHASFDWELDEASLPPASVDEEQAEQDDNQDEVQPNWEMEVQDVNWHEDNPQQHSGNEWEIINELRTEIAGLQQRMNSMQSMLEACMDMQLELQRSVRQEVSAALNQSIMLSDACQDNFPMDETKWDHVRKGICCMCCDSNIDSLLYRCGHMCACSKCAEKLIQGGKCPMCRAPVIEVIRAYFIQ